MWAGWVCCRTQDDENQIQQGSRKQSLDFRNIATYAAPGFRHIAEDKKEDLKIRGMNNRRGGCAVSSVTQREEGSIRVKQARKKNERKVSRIFIGLMDIFKKENRPNQQCQGSFQSLISEKYTKHECYNTQANES